MIFIRWKAGTSHDTLVAWEKEVKDLKYKIPGIVWVSIAKQDCKVHDGYVDRSKGFTHTITYWFTDGNALKEFGPNKEHVRVKEKYITPLVDSLVVIDFFESDACGALKTLVESKVAPLVHIVAFKVKKDVSAEVKSRIRSEFGAIKKSIDGTLFISFVAADTAVYDGFVDRTQGWTHVLFSVFEDGPALQRYAVSEVHTSLKARLITPNIDDIMALDYLFPDNTRAHVPVELPPPIYVG